ncbi:hypothetical protein K503DRAFT_380432 [Rhizopogon vinicolor AM-OR11-026]|uniref:F-box domain-containing protein n=1 Tax=Rhizopogon vinicolor AM-OR11-026 TaxID=1314800 RepID=A0A1B7MRI0_9AGAM|nr:hypothetical protein K503DRAFT_380432 [Rhizopogon vinicolor AM-OR11-026]
MFCRGQRPNSPSIHYHRAKHTRPLNPLTFSPILQAKRRSMSSWPHIQLLKPEDPPFFDSGPPAVTFRGLFAALHLCPDLHTLQVSMDAMNIVIDPTFQYNSLRSLNVCNSGVANPDAVARVVLSSSLASTVLPMVDTTPNSDPVARSQLSSAGLLTRLSALYFDILALCSRSCFMLKEDEQMLMYA